MRTEVDTSRVEGDIRTGVGDATKTEIINYTGL
jgi:hypothetical protein